MAEKNVLEILITAKDEASGKLGGLFDALGGVGKGAGIAMGALGAAGGAVVKIAGDLAMSAAPAEQVQKTFENLAASIGEQSVPMLEELRGATRGMVDDTSLMQATNKFMSMGLANSSDEAAKLAEMATQLGSAMGQDATTSMGDFALMLANQAIPRLDNFGISSGKVRTRIDELMAADQSLSREQAFTMAVMEQGEVAMSRVGEQSGTTAGTMATMQATLENLKTSIGTALLPILAALATALTPLIEQIGPPLIEVATQVGGILTTDVIPALMPIVAQLIPPLLSMLPSLVSLFSVLAGSLMSALAPVLNTVVAIVTQLLGQLTPLIEALMPPLIELLGAVLGLVNALLPIVVQILSTAIIPLVEALLPPMIELLEKVVTAVADLASWLSTKLQPAFNGISGAIQGVVGWIGNMVDKLKNIKLPKWLTPGSPTPFELGLRGIADALQDVNADIGGLTVNASQPVFAGTGAGAGMGSVVVNINSPVNLADKIWVEQTLAPYIRDEIRRTAIRG